MNKTKKHCQGVVLSLSLAALCVFVAAATNAATSYTWNPNGSGGWSDPNRWTTGTASTPRVIIDGCTATLTDSDLEWASDNLEDIVFKNDGVLDLNIANDGGVLPSTLMLSGTGLVVKKGEGAFKIATKESGVTGRNTLPSRGVRIEAGELTFSKNAGPIEVLAPGRLRPRTDATFDCYGLSGDGFVTNDVVKQLRFVDGTSDNPYVFSGRFLCKIDLSLASGGCQYITNPEAAIGANGDVRLGNGTIGVQKFGRKNNASSLGGLETYWCRGITRILYLGGGEDTTDHQFKFNTDAGATTFDAGATGGVNFAGDIYTSDGGNKMCQLVLDGSNANACVISGAIHEKDGLSTYITKTGTGTWEFAGTSGGNHGAMAVRQGTLRYASMADAGENCALGYADRLYEDYTGAIDTSRTVPYAYLLGDGETYSMDAPVPALAGTFEYSGSDGFICLTRPMQVFGIGRLGNCGGSPITFSGVTAASDGSHALVLKSPEGFSEVRNVTNGVGSISVVKEGAGTWTVTGDMDFDGVDVRDGTLKLRTVDSCKYFRFAVKENYNGVVDKDGKTKTDSRVQLYGFGFYDADGNCQSFDLSYRGCVGDVTELRPGEITDLRTFNASGKCPISPRRGMRDVENMFTNLTTSVITANDCIWSGNVTNQGVMVIGNEDTWPGFICRLPDGAAPIAYYDIRAGAGVRDGTNYVCEAKSWILEGSADGANWTTLHDVNTNAHPVTASYVWYSNNREGHSASNGYGYDISDKTTFQPRALSRPIAVRVDEGATLVSDGEVAVSKVVYDYAQGGGTLDGFAFAANGTFELVNLPAGTDVATLPMTLVNMTGMANMRNWSVSVAGEQVPTMRVRATTDGFKIAPVGSVIIFR